jgi:23S rRNA (cytidine1920-2'-O)/16S rRNA (cytidine1409-2'-O)-methyltransferase
MRTGERLDRALVSRGLVSSRHRARQMILAGAVCVNGQVVQRPSYPTPPDAQLSLRAPMPYVGRGGLKLEAALQAFGLDVHGLVALDVGASTGGFTDCLLQRGAARVYAVDVGHGQLHPRLRSDPRVVLFEGVDIRALDQLPERPGLAVVDVSFISLRLVLPAVARLVWPGQVLALFKPQFEVGRSGLGSGGIVRRPQLREAARREFEAWLARQGWSILGAMQSPVPGMDGNVEYFYWLQPPEPKL